MFAKSSTIACFIAILSSSFLSSANCEENNAYTVLLQNNYDARSCIGTYITKKHVVTSALCVCGCDNTDRKPFLLARSAKDVAESKNSIPVVKIDCQPLETKNCDAQSFYEKSAILTLGEESNVQTNQEPIVLSHSRPVINEEVKFSTLRNSTDENFVGTVKDHDTCLESQRTPLTFLSTAYGKLGFRHRYCAMSSALFHPYLGAPVFHKNKLVGVLFYIEEIGTLKRYFYTDTMEMTTFATSVVPHSDFANFVERT